MGAITGAGFDASGATGLAGDGVTFFATIFWIGTAGLVAGWTMVPVPGLEAQLATDFDSASLIALLSPVPRFCVGSGLGRTSGPGSFTVGSGLTLAKMVSGCG